MKYRSLSIFAALLLIAHVTAFASVVTDLADTEKYPRCPLCDMDRKQFAFARILVTYDDASESGYCSLHCAAIAMAIHLDKAPIRIQVGDYDTRELIDAEAAVWVIGGARIGVMTHRGKWAFKDRSRAEAFIGTHGGTTADFETAVKTAYEDMYADSRAAREKRKKTAVMHEAPAAAPPKPSPEEKCPVCGMFVGKYPDWIGVITFKDGRRHYFDGAKDLFKYLFDIETYNSRQKVADIRDIHVTDYYDMKFIDARAAFYVMGSDVYGPMGRELIPLSNRPDAETFMKDHKGIRILQFNEITPEIIRRLDE
ncbi:nitrous oxide reductase accessory protein NosL [Desulfococcus multivorans]|uniref:NosL family protein n=1 Tax=Desulfococcus multivorans DSM 2059 TaxID=1121405 RepID=S7U0P4_DESML|nr:nitrous oxide reductase accessory protein NosL [Desulfococcus multivorans]AOY59305.1 conserved uncharacterized protein [Desulfococcus multivorans]EPR43001.1 NosL family protein [Desulfococcus multivorans DSM 2059]SKA14667.1 Nitrous oxide reductase accessory protein NosL [Desulfococcus multivorans DSM 2059]